MRTIQLLEFVAPVTIQQTTGSPRVYTALRVQRDSENDEYHVQFLNGKKVEDISTYFTCDKQDALDTQQFEFNRLLGICTFHLLNEELDCIGYFSAKPNAISAVTKLIMADKKKLYKLINTKSGSVQELFHESYNQSHNMNGSEL